MRDAGNGDDYLWAGDGNDTLNGGTGEDYIITGSGKNTVNAGDGDDEILITLADGADKVDGGAGIDEIEIRNISGTFTAKASTVVNTLADGTTIVNIENYDLYGTNDKNTIVTLGGKDHIVTYDGDDTVKAGAGDDYIDGGAGNDKLYGEAGNDTIFAGSGKDAIDGGSGTDTVYIDVYSYQTINYTFDVVNGKGTLSNGSYAQNTEIFNIFTSAYGDDVLKAGNAQSVWFKSYSGNDQLYGSAGDDLLDSGLGNDKIVAGKGDDVLYDLGGNNNLSAGDGDDEVHLSIFEAHAGGDTTTLDLGAGNDSVEFNAGLGYTFGKLNADGGTGTDLAIIDRNETTKALTFTLSANATVVNGDVTLKNFERIDITGGSGADKFTGGNLSDSLDGNDGNDTLVGLGGDDWIYGGNGRDTLKGGDGRDTIWASGSSDDAATDTIDAGAGDDYVHINNGDTAIGGTGIDTVYVDVSALTTGVKFTSGTGTVKVNATTSYSGMEALDFTGTKGNDVVTGGAGSDTLRGNAGNDTLNGGAGKDFLYDDAGNDTLLGGTGDDSFTRNEFTGKDVFDGGAGIDTLDFNYYGYDASVKLDLLDSTKNDGLARGLTVKNIERIWGTSQDDEIRGSNASDWMSGGGKDDVLSGRGGDDTLIGGSGGDQITGGAGKDVFQFSYITDGGDQITDFKRGEDKIAIDGDGFGLKAGAPIKLVLSNEAVFTTAGSTFLFEQDTHRLWFDADGKGGDKEAVLLATLDNVSTLSTSDFLLI